ncbi:DUF4339 domain-containing protein [Burkholderia sp. LMG 32019]|uniref:DUF4339 domain-containing protein n=1 Tax=Burkholderia sp. LMG 32019 TaxID=3158173 RepID=UPI003C2F0CFF
MSTWHYEKDGNRLGPVSDDDVRQLIQQRAIASHTLIWKQGFTDWRALAETELARYLEAATAPPALPAASISNVVVWMLAVAPLIGMAMEAMLAGALAPTEELAGLAGQLAVKTGQYWWVTSPFEPIEIACPLGHVTSAIPWVSNDANAISSVPTSSAATPPLAPRSRASIPSRPGKLRLGYEGRYGAPPPVIAPALCRWITCMGA